LDEKDKNIIEDNLIRRALQLEIESVEPPAADKMWRTYAGLAAAACLLLVFGSIGLLQVVQFVSPASEFDAAAEFIALDEEERSEAMELAESEALEEPLAIAPGPEAEPDAVIEKQKQNTDTVTVTELDEELADKKPTVAAIPANEESAMQLWPETLGKDYLFSEEIVLPPVEEEPLRVALYSGPEYNLLLVSLEALEENPIDFVEKIGLQMQFPINDFQYSDKYLFFVAGGYNGLVFKHDGMTRAILVPLNQITKEQLIDLAAPFR